MVTPAAPPGERPFADVDDDPLLPPLGPVVGESVMTLFDEQLGPNHPAAQTHWPVDAEHVP